MGDFASLGYPCSCRLRPTHGDDHRRVAEIMTLKSKVRRLEEGNAALKAATVFFVGELDPRNRLGVPPL